MGQIAGQRYYVTETDAYVSHAVWVKKIPPSSFLTFFPKQLGIFNQFFSFRHLLCVPIYAKLLSTLDYKFLFNYLQLCRSYAILSETTHRIFLHFTRTWLLSLLTEQITSLLTSCHIQHVSWQYKSSRSWITCHRQRTTKLSTTFTNVWTHAFWPMVDILSICELGSRA